MAAEDTAVGSVVEVTKEKGKEEIVPDWASRVAKLLFTWPYQNMGLMRDIGKCLHVYSEVNHRLLQGLELSDLSCL